MVWEVNLPHYYYSNFQYFPHFFQYQYQYQYQKSEKFQYQYQNQYFETVVFNIKININMTKILTFQNFSKFCPMSACTLLLPIILVTTQGLGTAQI